MVASSASATFISPPPFPLVSTQTSRSPTRDSSSANKRLGTHRSRAATLHRYSCNPRGSGGGSQPRNPLEDAKVDGNEAVSAGVTSAARLSRRRGSSICRGKNRTARKEGGLGDDIGVSRTVIGAPRPGYWNDSFPGPGRVNDARVWRTSGPFSRLENSHGILSWKIFYDSGSPGLTR